MMPLYNPITDSQIASALLRLVVVYVCAQGYYLLGPRCKNYRTPPWYVRPPIACFGAVSIANVADLIARALSTVRPHPLLTGYLLSVTEATLALALYGWLLTSWRPEAIQTRSQRRAESWAARIGTWPCVRRKMVIRERIKQQEAEQAVEAGQLQSLHDLAAPSDAPLRDILRGR